jgi:AbrB family looped-hinge helix DNA binding protein
MTYRTSITSKGQIAIPKEFRDHLQLRPSTRLIVELGSHGREIVIKPPVDFMEFARNIKVKKKIDPVKAREYMEKHYERV